MLATVICIFRIFKVMQKETDDLRKESSFSSMHARSELIKQNRFEMDLYNTSTYDVFVNYMFNKYNTNEAIINRIHDSIKSFEIIFIHKPGDYKEFLDYLKMIAADLMSNDMRIDSSKINNHVGGNCKAHMSKIGINTDNGLMLYFTHDCVMTVTGFILMEKALQSELEDESSDFKNTLFGKLILDEDKKYTNDQIFHRMRGAAMMYGDVFVENFIDVVHCSMGGDYFSKTSDEAYLLVEYTIKKLDIENKFTEEDYAVLFGVIVINYIYSIRKESKSRKYILKALNS